MIIGLSALVEPIARKFFKVHDDFKISSVVAVIEVLSEKRGLAAVVMVVVVVFVMAREWRELLESVIHISLWVNSLVRYSVLTPPLIFHKLFVIF
jgi:dephospho-CoA kinase